MAIDPSRRGVIGAGLAGLAVSAPARAQSVETPRERVFNVRDFGATGRPDGDDTSAFLAMHREMMRIQSEHDAAFAASPFADRPDFVVHLPPGTYRYRWNRWTWGLRRVSVFGYGAALQCMHAGPYDADQAPLLSNRDHYWSWPLYGAAYSGPGPAEDHGRLIETADPGDRFLRMKDDPPPLAVGEWVLVQSVAQQLDGYPPNMRRHDRARVVAVDGRTVHLDRALRHTHPDDAPELPAFPLAPGRARLVRIDRPDCPLAVTQVFAGLTVLSNPRHARLDPVVKETLEVFNVAGVIDASLRDCRFIALGVSQADTVTVENCRIGYTEPDKVLNRLVFDRCRIRSLQQCTGVENLVLRRCVLEETAQMLAREVDAEGCDFLGASHPAGSGRAINLVGTAPTRTMRLVRNRFFGGGRARETALGGEIWETFVIHGQDVRTDGLSLFVRGTTTAYRNVVELVEDGTVLRISGAAGNDRTVRCTGLHGVADGLILDLEEGAQVSDGDTVSIPRLNRLLMRENTFSAIGTQRPDPPKLVWEE